MQRQPVVTVPNLALPPEPAPSHPCPTGPPHSPTRRCTQELTPLGDSAGAAPSLAPPLPRRPRPAPCRLGTSPPRPSPPLEPPPHALAPPAFPAAPARRRGAARGGDAAHARTSLRGGGLVASLRSRWVRTAKSCRWDGLRAHPPTSLQERRWPAGASCFHPAPDRRSQEHFRWVPWAPVLAWGRSGVHLRGSVVRLSPDPPAFSYRLPPRAHLVTPRVFSFFFPLFCLADASEVMKTHSARIGKWAIFSEVYACISDG